MATTKSRFSNIVELNRPIAPCYDSSKPIYYKSSNNHNQYLFIITYNNNIIQPKTRLIKYDIKKDCHVILGEMNGLIQEPFGYWLNHKNNKLYVINTDKLSSNNDQNASICDLNTATWEKLNLGNNYKTRHDVWINLEASDFYNINEEIHYLHQNSEKIYQHHIFDQVNNTITKITNNSIQMRGDQSCTAYLADLNKFICVTTDSNNKHKMYSLNINNMNHGNKWRKCRDIEFPMANYERIKVILPYENILVCFGELQSMNGCKEQTIWCLDVTNNKWYESVERIALKRHIVFNKKYFISTGGRYCYYYNYRQSLNCRIDLYAFCPMDLKKHIQSRYIKKCCFGYCRRNEMEYNMILPDYLKRIVFRYSDH